MIDVLIAGAGPIGLATALYAARCGLQVVVVEPRATPIDKACGEGLMPSAVEALDRLGVQPAGVEFNGIRYTDGIRFAEARFAARPGLGVRRTELQRALHARVADAGVEMIEATVGEVEQRSDQVRTAGLVARYLVAADGLHSRVRESLGLAVDHAGARRWGTRRHFAVPAWTDLVEVHWSDDAEAYVTPIGPAEVGVAVLTSRRASYDEQLRGFGALSEHLAGAAPSTPVLGAGPLRQSASRRVLGRVALVGDAAGYVDAITGEGVAVGLASAEALVECLARDDLAAYEGMWRRRTRRYRTLTTGLLWASGRPALRRQIVPVAARFPPLYGAVVRQLAR
ncbi:flavin-dependent dehydrogenase [Antricoccus suffuscus]|uniref:Flavin-dependent dehydrogenase n=1 Tax=Antricoccus suffuscus TaxID=1629062 RepID=A0A2T1A353_9ACTN|nr:NAD(P)/FAD-dependent oxidoreductase [Antricoccus suffuscus]PRZ43035.1 flavin-dependent dehydrogenase [Antricoccus suffuscus]